MKAAGLTSDKYLVGKTVITYAFLHFRQKKPMSYGFYRHDYGGPAYSMTTSKFQVAPKVEFLRLESILTSRPTLPIELVAIVEYKPEYPRIEAILHRILQSLRKLHQGEMAWSMPGLNDVRTGSLQLGYLAGVNNQVFI